MVRKPTDMVQLKLRFPEALRRRLEREAKKHGQSLNAEIVMILEGRFRESDGIQERAKAIAEALGEEFVNAMVKQAKWDELRDMFGNEQQHKYQLLVRKGPENKGS